MSSCFLTAPIQIEAIYLQKENGYLAVEPMANFQNLPYCDRNYVYPSKNTQQSLPNNKGYDFEAATPYISENIVSQPFQNRNLHLSPGIHLHWNLPNALKTGTYKQENLSFPTAPNRWLVIRKRGDIIEHQWMIESDYLWPEINKFATDTEQNIPPIPRSVSIPIEPNENLGQYQPFRYLGRQISLEDWLQESSHDEQEYWGEILTVIGYGEPSFAAFYPNCYSIFGCYDSEPGNLDDSLSYEIIGWHSETNFDYIQSLISEEWRNSGKSLKDFIQDQINWKLETSENIEYDVQTLYYGRLEFQLERSKSLDEILETQPELDSVILANSGTEALSAYIAHQVQQNDSSYQKHDVENQLEAIQLLSSLETEVEDLDQKLREARHEKEFIAHSSGILWSIEKIDKNQKPEFHQKSEHKDSKNSLLELPESIVDQLKKLNQIQEKNNRLQPEIESQRQQIFADWYKYLICLYPPVSHLESYPKPERVRDFMSHSEIKTLKDRTTEFEKLSTERDECKKVLEKALEDFNRELKVQASETPDNQSPEYQLKSIPAPRYWQPNEPVVMVVFKTDSEQAAVVTESEDREGLECAVLRLDFSENNKTEFIEELVKKVRETIKPGSPHQKQYLSVWRSQPWKPFLLEWEIQVTNIKTQRNYFSNFIERHYPTSLTHSDRVLIDFQPPDNLVSQQDLLKDVYSGRSLLTDYAANQHQQQIEAFFTRKRFFDDFCKDRSIEAKSGWLAQHSEALKQWLDNSQISEEEQQLLNHLLEVYEGFKKIQCLSQTLDGVNQALLGRKQTLQLAIDDPIGFECDRWFVEQVCDAVQDSITSAPQPLNFFNPIRAGILKILRLRLVDTFGRVRDLAWEQTITPEHLSVSLDNAVNLPPRIVQPARVQFRWLSSNPKHVTEEAASHPSLNPICGWILLDRIDQTLEIYNTQGDSLGELEIKKAGSPRWRASPGSEYAVESVEKMLNPHLQRVIRYLDECDAPLLDKFVESINKACEQIDPEVAGRDPSLALLMGQPIAIVRASLDLQLQGLPVVNQDWAIFKQELQKFKRSDRQPIERETNGFTDVQFPIYLGNYQSLNDGLVGYWREIHNQETGISLSPKLYIPVGEKEDQNQQSDQNSKRIVNQHQPLPQTLRSPPEFITALIDPRATLQIASRVLPTKFVQIPSEHYANILNKISLSFLTAPLLSCGRIDIALANIPNYNLLWLEQQSPEQWLKISNRGKIERNQFIARYDKIRLKFSEHQNVPSGEQVWEHLLQEEVGWLEPINNELKYSVIPTDERKSKTLEPPYQSLQKSINVLLDILADQVRPTTTEAIFSQSEIYEGWLQLTPLSQK